MTSPDLPEYCECDWEPWHKLSRCPNPPMDHGPDIRTSPELCGPCLYGCEAERDELAEGKGPWAVSP